MISKFNKSFATTNDKLAELFLDEGARVRVLYAFDGVTTYNVKLRGRAECRLLKDPDVVQQFVGNAFEAMRVVRARVAPPIYTLTVNDKLASVEDKGQVLLPFGRDPEYLLKIVTPPGGVLPAGIETVDLLTWADVNGVLNGPHLDGVNGVRFFLGAVPGRPQPYQETYDLKLTQVAVKAMVDGDGAEGD